MLPVATEQEHYRPRVIIWQLTRGRLSTAARPDEAGMLSADECARIIDSIAQVSRPILVLTGAQICSRSDLRDIVLHAISRGLKVIIEAAPGDITPAVLADFRQFGSRIFRLVIDGCIIEDMDTRYRQTPEFRELETAVSLLRDAGFEIHFSLTVTTPDSRILAFNLDYAFRKSAQGLYCHLCFHRLNGGRNGNGKEIDAFIDSISDLKPSLPGEMYFSPQCVRFGANHRDEDAEDHNGEPHDPHRWAQWCVAGKSFAFITETGKVQLCSGCDQVCGDLRNTGYDFQSIWTDSRVFRTLREHRWTCGSTRQQIHRRRAGVGDQNKG